MTVSSYEAFCNDLRQDFATNIETALSVPTQYENAIYAPVQGTRWCSFNVLFGEERHASIGPAHTFRFVGVLLVRIYSRLDHGSKSGLEIADAIANRYRGVTLAGVTFQAPSIASQRRELGWWVTTVECRFKADRLI